MIQNSLKVVTGKGTNIQMLGSLVKNESLTVD